MISGRGSGRTLFTIRSSLALFG